MNHYETLGVKPDADPADIKKAFRKKAQDTHPDREGGDQQAFRQVTRAYKVLSDPQRRDRYDRTGQDDEPQDPDATAAEVLSSLFDRVIQDSDHVGDLVERVKKTVRQQQSGLQTDVVEAQRKLRKLDKLQGRVQAADSNLFQDALRQRIQETEARLADFNEALEVLERVSKLLDDYRDERPEQPVAPPYFGQSSAFASALGGGPFTTLWK